MRGYFRRIFIAGLCAVVVTVLISLWLNTPNEQMRDLHSRIQRSNLPEIDKLLTSKLVLNRIAWESQLIHEIVHFGWRRIVWEQQAVTKRGRPIRIFIMDVFARPVSTAPAPNPLLCIVTDDELNLLHWDEIGTYSMGFISASIQSHDEIELTVTSFTNWFFGKATYRYRITDSEIDEIAEMESQQIPPGTNNHLPYNEDPPALRDALHIFRDGSGPYWVTPKIL